MDTINEDWVVNTDRMATQFEDGIISATDFSNDQLQWLIYWNWGYSGAGIAKVTTNAIAELNARGIEVNSDIAEAIDLVVMEYV